jgi:Zn-dependent protease
VGMVIIPIISIFLIKWPIGFAVTPYDPAWAYRNPRKAGWMAAAGPLANLALLLIAYAVIEAGIYTGFFIQPDSLSARQLVDPSSPGILNGLAIFMSMLFSMNLILFFLNIFPMPPLDGSGIVALFLKEDSARKYKDVISHPAFGFIGLLLVWWVFSPIFSWLFVRILSLVYWGHTFYFAGAVLPGLSLFS